MLLTDDTYLDSVQTISGTGANHLGALFLSRFYQWNGPKVVYLSNPTWGVYMLSLTDICLSSHRPHPTYFSQPQSNLQERRH